MIELSRDVRASLTDAGIGSRFHDTTLAALGSEGEALLRWLSERGGEQIKGGQTVVFTGIGTTDLITVLARGLHLSGFGCRLMPLVRMRKVITTPSLYEEIRDDIAVLVILNAQDTRRECPLHPSSIAEVEYIVRERHAARKTTILQMAIPETSDLPTLPNLYWSDEFLDFLTAATTISKDGLRRGIA